MKLYSPSVARNRDVIRDALTSVLPARGLLVELAAGSGEHAAHISPYFPELTWVPTDVDDDALASITGWLEEGGAPRVRSAQRFDVTVDPWRFGPTDVILAINLVHYVRWAVTVAMFDAAGAHLRKGGVLVTYGAYTVGGAHTAPSNVSFDAWLKGRDPESGVRDLADMRAQAERVGLTMSEPVPMPANNFLLVFTRG